MASCRFFCGSASHTWLLEWESFCPAACGQYRKGEMSSPLTSDFVKYVLIDQGGRICLYGAYVGSVKDAVLKHCLSLTKFL